MRKGVLKNVRKEGKLSGFNVTFKQEIISPPVKLRTDEPVSNQQPYDSYAGVMRLDQASH